MARKHYNKLEHRDFAGGMDLYPPADSLAPNRFRDGENFRCARGNLELRPGSEKWNQEEWRAGEKVNGLFRYYYEGDSIFLIASGADLRVGNVVGGVNTVSDGFNLGMAEMNQATFAQFRDKVYVAHDSPMVGIIRYDPTSDKLVDDPASAPTVAAQSTTLLAVENSFPWTTTHGDHITLATETSKQAQGAGCLKAYTHGDASSHFTLTYDPGTGNALDWSDPDEIKFLLYAGKSAGTATDISVTMKFSEGGGVWQQRAPQTVPLDGKWAYYTWDISGISAASRDAIHTLSFYCEDVPSSSSVSTTIMVDCIYTGSSHGMGEDRIYAFVYYDGTSGQYSLLSPYSAIERNFDDDLDNVITGPASPQENVSQIRVYRTKGDDLQAPTFYLVDTLANPVSGTWSYEDTKSDDDLGAEFTEYPVPLTRSGAVALTSEKLDPPLSAPTVTQQSTTLFEMEDITGWSRNYSDYVTLSLDTEEFYQGEGSLKAFVDGGTWHSITSFRISYTYATTQNWSDLAGISYYIRAICDNWTSIQSRIRWSKDNSTWYGPAYQTVFCGAGWTRLSFDLSGIAGINKEEVKYVRIEFNNLTDKDKDTTIYIDYVYSGGSVGVGQDREYAYAYYSSDTKKYSLLSPVSAVVRNLDENTQNLVGGAQSAQEGISKVRIYRTKAGDNLTNPTFYFLDEVANPESGDWSYLDNKSDSSLGDMFVQYSASGVQAPPDAASIVLLHEDRMFYAGDSDNPSRVSVSNWQDPETVPGITLPTDYSEFTDETGGYLDIARQNGQKITCLVESGEAVLALKENSAYYITGDSFNPFGSNLYRYDLISDVAGCVGPWAAAFCENSTCWVDRNTVWSWSPGNLVDIGQPIASIIAAIPAACRKYVSCVYHDRKLVISYTPGGADYNTHWLELDFRTHAWTKHTGQRRGPMVVAKSSGDSGELYFGDSDLAYIWQAEVGRDDDGTGITGKFLDRAIVGGGDTLRLRYLDLVAGATSGDIAVTGSIYRGGGGALGAAPDETVGYSLAGSGVRTIEASVSDANTATSFQVGLEVTSDEAVELWAIYPYLQKVR
jgi:hypothetical protein